MQKMYSIYWQNAEHQNMPWIDLVQFVQQNRCASDVPVREMKSREWSTFKQESQERASTPAPTAQVLNVLDLNDKSEKLRENLSAYKVDGLPYTGMWNFTNILICVTVLAGLLSTIALVIWGEYVFAIASAGATVLTTYFLFVCRVILTMAREVKEPSGK